MDLSTTNIKKLFEKQVTQLTRKSFHREELFDLQLNGGWLK